MEHPLNVCLHLLHGTVGHVVPIDKYDVLFLVDGQSGAMESSVSQFSKKNRARQRPTSQ